MKFNISFPFVFRQSEAVANAVAMEILELTGGVGMTKLPDLLSVSGQGESLAFRYEGGIVVRPHLVNRGAQWQDWAVTHVTVRYYPEYGYRGTKIEEVWDHNHLFALKQGERGWYHPHVQGPDGHQVWKIEKPVIVDDGEPYEMELAFARADKVLKRREDRLYNR